MLRVFGFCILNERDSYRLTGVEDIAAAIADSAFEDFIEAQILVDCSVAELDMKLEAYWKSYYGEDGEDNIEEQRELFEALLDDQSIRTGV